MKALLVLGPIVVALFLVWLWIERWHLILPGTWPALKWLGFKRTLSGGLHGIWYGRHITSYLNFLRNMAYICGPDGKYAKWLENSYHGKVLPPELAKSIVSIKEDVPLQDLGVKVIPYSRARDIVIKAPPDIVITQCGCKELHRLKGDPCRISEEPYMTCMLIGKPLTDFLLDHKPEYSERISNERALELLDSFHKAGLVHNAWFKDCIKDQFYVICNCCSCCCLGFKTKELGIRQLAPSGYVADVNRDICRGCETAYNWCPFDAIEIVDEKSYVKRDWCMGCGICVSKCPAGARLLVLDEKRGLPLDVRNLGGYGGDKEVDKGGNHREGIHKSADGKTPMEN
jgi:Pyruvate/2-oxoacid:ferredoxin oxidoreductase delta subunit